MAAAKKDKESKDKEPRKARRPKRFKEEKEILACRITKSANHALTILINDFFNGAQPGIIVSRAIELLLMTEAARVNLNSLHVSDQLREFMVNNGLLAPTAVKESVLQSPGQPGNGSV